MKVLFWDVDTQYDFMMPEGKLYVRDAEKIIEKLAALTAYARKKGIQIVASVDDHTLEDPEISDQPDFDKTFPPHCLHGTGGQEKIAASKPLNPLLLETTRRYERGELEKIVRAHKGEMVLTKKRFDVFSNPNVDLLLDILAPADIYIYGVALDVCVAHAIEGFLKRGNSKVHFVEDVSKAIYPEKSAALIAGWKARGVEVTQCQNVVDPRRKIG